MRTIVFSILILISTSGWGLTQSTSAKPNKSGLLKSARATLVEGTVQEVEDSDRLTLASTDGKTYSLALLAVDAPDEKQNYHKKAKKRLAELIEGKEVKAVVRTAGNDPQVAVVYFGGQDIGLRLIQDGLAWYSVRGSGGLTADERDKYIQAETAAKASELGLWEDSNPVAPWTFRGEKNEPEISTAAAVPDASAVSTPKSVPVPGRKYVLGPRGGCYYLNDKGHKVYVRDKSLCTQE